MSGKIRTAVILLSRQNLRPSLKDDWVKNLKKAIEFVKSEGWTLCSSLGTPNWEIVTAGAALGRVPLKLFIPVNCAQSVNELLNSFGLDKHDVRFTTVGQDKTLLSKEEIWKVRDHHVISAAEIIIPVSIRPGGSLSESVDAAKCGGKNVNIDFQVKYNKSAPKLSYTLDEAHLSNEIKEIGNDYVIHWTRSSNAPWPNEKKLDYYKSVFSSLAYPRNALNTLQRIIGTKQIIAASRNMPGKVPTVSFSGLAPIETIKLMKWRSRYRQMSFEPYGIGVKKNVALSLGMKEVRYHDANSNGRSNSVPAWLTQSMGKITDWSNEKEYRHKGDFDLSAVANDHLITICHRKAEANELGNRLDIKSVSFCN